MENKYWYFFLLLISLSMCNISYGQNITSRSNSKEYELYVSLPYEYDTNKEKHYPVVYILDAYYSYPIVSSLHRLLDSSQEIQEIIIVAIGDKDKSTSTWFKSRMEDFTPSNDSEVDKEIANGLGISELDVRTGGAKEYLQTIRKDIIPFIDSQYRTTTDRGIIGHSVGGLFVAYSLLHAQDMFNKFGINSSSLFWNDQEVVNKAKEKLNTDLISKKEIFLSYGSLEPDVIISSNKSFLNILEKLKPKGFIVRSKVFEEETHNSVIASSLTRALKVLYGK